MQPLSKGESIRELHQSEIQTFLKCGKMWEFRYVQGIRTPPRAALTVGRAVDAAITHNFAQKIESGKDLPANDLIDVCATEFEKEAVETEFKPDENKGEEKDVAVDCVKAHTRDIAPNIQPASVQWKFTMPVMNAGFQLGGTLDLITKDDWVRDSKTSARKGMYSAAGTVQAGLYDFAFESKFKRKAKGFGYDIMIKPTKTMGARTEVVDTQVTANDRQFVFDTILSVDKAMRAGVALPAPETAWWCSAGWCGYWNICKGKK